VPALSRVLLRSVRRVWREDAKATRRQIEEAGIQSSFFVCATPRSGSNMLARLLHGTKLVGLAGERFNAHEFPDWARARPASYLLECARDAHGTGVFGLKLHWDQQERFRGLLRALRGVRGLTDHELIEFIFPRPHYIWLRREDTVAQGVSWWRAKTSGVWLGGEQATGEPRFDYAEIDARVRRCREHDDAWARWFSEGGIEPLQLTYEQIVSDAGGTVQRALVFVGVKVPDDLVVEQRTAKQADDLNKEWIHRYRHLATAALDTVSHACR
jgi:LPS sulfotransferase NodH